MSRRLVMLVAVAVALMLGLSAVAVASAPKMMSFAYSGKNADAGYSEGDWESGGAFSGAWVWGGEGKQVSNNTGEKNGVTRIQSGSFNCESYVPASGGNPETYRILFVDAPGTFTCDKDLDSASLKLVAAAGEEMIWYDVMPWEAEVMPNETNPVTANVDAVWDGQGPLWNESYASKTRTDGFMGMDRSKSLRRDATAVVKAIGVDGTVYFDGEFLMGGIYDTKGLGHFKGEYPMP